MIEKCINCCKWITCNNNIKENCENFKFKRIEIEKSKKEDKENENK